MSDAPQLSQDVVAIMDRAPTLYLSIASIWEIAIKHGLGKLDLSIPIHEMFGPGLAERRVEILAITVADTVRYASLGFPEPRRRDPFDRILVAHALDRGLTIVSADSILDAYGVTRLWE